MLEFTVSIPNPAATVVVEQPVTSVAVSPAGVQGVKGDKGDKGDQGLPGDGVPVVGETLTGSKDGVNTVFTTVSVFRPGTTAVYLNGLREFHYAETGASQITIEDPPHSGDTLRIDYVV